MMQKFWDSALNLEPPDDELDSRRFFAFQTPSPKSFFFKVIFFFSFVCSDVSMLMASECAEGKYTNPPSVGHSFAFKLEDRKGRVHRFNSGECAIVFLSFNAGLLGHASDAR